MRTVCARPRHERPRVGCPLLLSFLLLGSGAACNQAPVITPRIDRVIPRVLGPGERRFLLVDGAGFEPALSWSAHSGKGSVDSEMAVSFDDGPFTTSNVHLLHPGRLSVLVPEQLGNGWHSLAVRIPSGRQARLAEAFYVDPDGHQELILPCPDDNGDGTVELPELGLCKLVKLDDSHYIYEFFLDNVVTSFIDGDDISRAGGWQHGFVFSSGGHWLAYLRAATGNPPTLSLVLRHLPSGREKVVDQLSLSVGNDDLTVSKILWEQPLRATFSTPAFSPDESLLAYVRQANQVMLLGLNQDMDAMLPPFPLARPLSPDGSLNQLFYPDIDAGNRFVLVSEVRFGFDGEGNEREPGMKPLLINIGDGSVKRLQEESPSFDGPAAFLPSGAEIVFASDRLGLAILTPLGFTAPAIKYYRVGLFGSPVNPIPSTNAVYLFGPLRLSDDGALIASAGFLTTSGSGIDIVVTDLNDGWQVAGGKDAIDYCFPTNVTEDCQQLGYLVGQSLPCCQWHDNDQTQCCSADSSWLCPTWNLLPVFEWGGQTMLSMSLALSWMCGQNDEGNFRFMPYPVEFHLALSHLEQGQVSGEDLLITQQAWLPVVPGLLKQAKLPEGSSP